MGLTVYKPLAKCLDPLNLTWIMPAEGSDLIFTRPLTLSKLGGLVFLMLIGRINEGHHHC